MFENPLDLCVDVDNLLNTLLRYNGFYMLTVTDNAALPVEAPLKNSTSYLFHRHCISPSLSLFSKENMGTRSVC